MPRSLSSHIPCHHHTSSLQGASSSAGPTPTPNPYEGITTASIALRSEGTYIPNPNSSDKTLGAVPFPVPEETLDDPNNIALMDEVFDSPPRFLRRSVPLQVDVEAEPSLPIVSDDTLTDSCSFGAFDQPEKDLAHLKAIMSPL